MSVVIVGSLLHFLWQGALIGALIVGIARAAAVHLVPQLELFVIYAVMALVLGFRPYGLFHAGTYHFQYVAILVAKVLGLTLIPADLA